MTVYASPPLPSVYNNYHEYNFQILPEILKARNFTAHWDFTCVFITTTYNMRTTHTLKSSSREYTKPWWDKWSINAID